MMSYATWMAETKRNVFTPRSDALKALDAAFQAFDQATTGKLQKKIALVDRLLDWMKAQTDKKQDWRTSTRNSYKVNGKGTVERLVADLATDSTFSGRLAGLLQPTTTTTSDDGTYVPGKWKRAADSDGHWHDFVLQERGNSCGPACVAMVKRAFHNLSSHQLSEELIRGLVALAEQNRLHEGISGLSPDARNAHNWRDVGSNNGGLIEVLKANPHPVPTARDGGGRSHQQLLDELQGCTARKPSIIGWNWSGGGGHWTVCAGPTRDNTSLVLLDPWHGIQYLQNDLAHFSRYKTGALDFNDPVLTS